MRGDGFLAKAILSQAYLVQFFRKAYKAKFTQQVITAVVTLHSS